jgi:phage terminase large subunit
MNIKTAELFAPVYNRAFKSIMNHTKERWTFTGGRASCKSSFISICIVLLIVIFPKLNALILRRYSKSLRLSVFEQIVWAIDKLHMKRSNGKTAGFKIPKSRTAALPIIYIRKDGRQQQIIFTGLDDPEKLKSLKVSNGYIGILWIEEKTEVDPTDLQNVKISALRGGDTFYIFESYNPPSAMRHWCNAEARQNDPLRMTIHTTFLDIPKNWLGDAILHDMEQTKATNKRAYDNIYLGIATGTGRGIFENITLREITDDEIATFDYFYNGVDFGYYPDPFAFVAMSYNEKEARLYIFDELYLLKHGNFEAYNELKKHMEAHGQDIGRDRITADSAEPKSIADFRKFGADMRGAIKGRGSLEAGFKWLQSLREIVIDPVRCPHAADEFTLYEYEIDKRTGEIMTGYPQGQPDHALAAVRYALEEVWRHGGA